MITFKKYMLAAGAGLALGVAMALAAASASGPLGSQWPAQLRGDAQNRRVPPQMVLVVEPVDFGYRLGDQVPVTAYVRYPLNWRIDAQAAEMTGDFASLAVRSYDEQVRGSTNYVRVRFDVQSFAAKRVLQGTISVPCYEPAHGRQYIITGRFSAGTSPTWDGRVRLIPSSSDKATPNYWPAALLLLLGSGGCLWCTVLATRLGHARPKRSKPLSQREETGKRFFAAWSLVTTNGGDSDAVRSMDTIVRRWLKVEALLPQDVSGVVADASVAAAATTVLTHCESVLFAGLSLTDDQCAQIARAATVLFPEASSVLNAVPAGNGLDTAPPAVSKEV